MLQHLSPELFKEKIANFDGSDKNKFINESPTVIVFHPDIHLYAKGFRDVYDVQRPEYIGVKCYQVLTNRDPQIGEAYGIKTYPATMFINKDGKAYIQEGYIDPKEALELIKEHCLQ